MCNKLTITMEDIRACGGCAPSTRLFFRRYDLDYHDFLKNGIDAEELRKCHNAISDMVILYKERLVRGDS